VPALVWRAFSVRSWSLMVVVERLSFGGLLNDRFGLQ